MTVGLLSVAATPALLSGFPGQATNPVGFAATPSVAPTPWGGGGGGVSFPSGATWPGAYPGSLTSSSSGSFAGGSSGAPAVYSFLDINHQAGGITIGAHTVFVGCRFSLQETSQASNFEILGGSLTDVHFWYCDFAPLPSLYTAPPNAAWPTAGTGTPYYSSSSQWAASYAIANTASYEYIVNNLTPGPVTWAWCNVWGCGNPIALTATSAQITMQDCWFHDDAIADYTGTTFHQDGPGFLNGIQATFVASISGTTLTFVSGTTPPVPCTILSGPATGTRILSLISGSNYQVDTSQTVASQSMSAVKGPSPSNVKMLHCTVASIGNTRGYSWQVAETAYSNIVADSCYFSGYNGTLAFGESLTPIGSGWVFTNNIVSTDINWANGFIDQNYSTTFNKTSHPTNIWSNNKLKVVSGSATWSQWTSTFGSSAGPDWTGKDGYYLWPDGTLNLTEWPN